MQAARSQALTQQQARHRLECLRRMSQKHKMQYPQLNVHCTETTGHLLALQTADAVIKSNLSALGFGDVEL